MNIEWKWVFRKVLGVLLVVGPALTLISADLSAKGAAVSEVVYEVLVSAATVTAAVAVILAALLGMALILEW